MEEPAVEKISEDTREDPFQVLISTMLSAQTQDPVTAAASARLFRVARTPRTMAKLTTRRIERLIYPVSFYRNKARHVKETCRQLITRFGGPRARSHGGSADAARRRTEDREPGPDPLARQPRQHLRRHARPSHLEPAGVGEDPDARRHGAGALQAASAAMVAARQPVSGDVGPERLSPGLPAMRGVRREHPLSPRRGHSGEPDSRSDGRSVVRTTPASSGNRAIISGGYSPVIG